MIIDRKSDSESIVRIEDLSIREYFNFLNIKRIPSYRFDGKEFTVNTAFLSLIDPTQTVKELKFGDFHPRLFDYQKFIVELALQKKKFAIFADAGLGKCVDEDTWIPTNQGMIRIKDLKQNEEEIGPISIRVQSPDKNAEATLFYNSGIKPAIKIETRMGFNLVGTYDHPVRVLSKSGKLEWRKMRDLSIGDYVAIQRHDPIFGSKVILSKFESINNRGYSEEDKLMALKISRENNDILSKDCLKKIRKIINKKVSFDTIKNWRINGIKNRSSKKLNFPLEMNIDLAYAMGILTGDGCFKGAGGISLTSVDQEIISFFNKWINSLGLKVCCQNRINYLVYSNFLRRWFIQLGMSNTLAHEKTIPYSILCAPKEMISAFLRGLFDTDGWSLKNGGVGFASSSKELARLVHLILLQFGIVGRLKYKKNDFHGSWSINLFGSEAAQFYEKIGFAVKRKQERKSFLSVKFNTNIDIIPYLPLITTIKKRRWGIYHKNFSDCLRGIKKLSYSRLKEVAKDYPELAELLFPNYFWDEVILKKEDGKKQMYDLVVPDGHAFVSNGIVSHNTFMFLEWIKKLLPMVKGKALILSPLNICKQTIEEDVKFYGKSDIVDIYDTDIDRWLDGDSRIGIINYDKFRVPVDLHGKVDILVCDESSLFKSEDAVIKSNVIDAAKGIGYKLACTATPAPNDREEYANHAYFLDQIRSSKEFFVRYFINKDGDWVLKPHATEAFYHYLASFSIFLRDPKSYGFDDNLKDMKPLIVKTVDVQLTDDQAMHAKKSMGNGYYGFGMSIQMGGIVKRGKLNQISKGFVYEEGKAVSIESNKPEVICDIINGCKGSILIWSCYDEEGEILVRKIRESTNRSVFNLTGKIKVEDRSWIIADFKSGKIDILISKSKILGFGLNFQHCSTVIFSGMLDSYEQYYQELKRVYRYGNTKQVTIYIPLTQYEEVIYRNVLRKKAQFEYDAEFQEGLYKKYIMGELIDFVQAKERKKQMASDRKLIEMKHYTIVKSDNVVELEELDRLETDSVGFCIFSPPFASLFTYSSDIADMGNCGDSDQEFILNYKFFASRLLRVMMPGRKVAVHVSQLPILKSLTGYIGMKDFRGLIIQAMNESGFYTKGEVAIKKNQQMQSIVKHAPGLAMHIFESDSNKSLPCYNDYILIFEKPGENPVPITPVKNGDMTRNEWIKFASGCWMNTEELCDIRESDTLNTKAAKTEDDVKHICPLQLEVIRRFMKLYSNPGELVLDPFSGIGSTGTICGELGRDYYGIELKDEYFEESIKNVRDAYKKGLMRLGVGNG